LYVSGLGPVVQEQVVRLRALLDEACGDPYELTVCDIFDCPAQARADTVFATPTLVRLLPPPAAQVIGDLSDGERLTAALALRGRG
jgi:circadian clock protein KaiB